MPRNSKPPKPADNRISVRLRPDQLAALRKRSSPNNSDSDIVRAALDSALKLRRSAARY